MLVGGLVNPTLTLLARSVCKGQPPFLSPFLRLRVSPDTLRFVLFPSTTGSPAERNVARLAIRPARGAQPPPATLALPRRRPHIA